MNKTYVLGLNCVAGVAYSSLWTRPAVDLEESIDRCNDLKGRAG
jgi:hypothetical protein